MNNMETRIKDAYNKMTIDEQYKLMETLGGEAGGEREGDKDRMESISNVLVEGTTIVAKMVRVI